MNYKTNAMFRMKTLTIVESFFFFLYPNDGRRIKPVATRRNDDESVIEKNLNNFIL